MLIKEIKTCEVTLCEDEKKALEDAIATMYSIISQMEDANCEYFENSHDDVSYNTDEMRYIAYALERLKDMDTIY